MQCFLYDFEGLLGPGEISGSHGGEYEDVYPLGCCAV
jgi:hypothetical protein